jgi:hypothetical protein
MLLMLVVTLSTGLFSLGYYVGNQLGQTAHIREDLRKAREARVVARIMKR